MIKETWKILHYSSTLVLVLFYTYNYHRSRQFGRIGRNPAWAGYRPGWTLSGPPTFILGYTVHKKKLWLSLFFLFLRGGGDGLWAKQDFICITFGSLLKKKHIYKVNMRKWYKISALICFSVSVSVSLSLSPSHYLGFKFKQPNVIFHSRAITFMPDNFLYRKNFPKKKYV